MVFKSLSIFFLACILGANCFLDDRCTLVDKLWRKPVLVDDLTGKMFVWDGIFVHKILTDTVLTKCMDCMVIRCNIMDRFVKKFVVDCNKIFVDKDLIKTMRMVGITEDVMDKTMIDTRLLNIGTMDRDVDVMDSLMKDKLIERMLMKTMLTRGMNDDLITKHLLGMNDLDTDILMKDRAMDNFHKFLLTGKRTMKPTIFDIMTDKKRLL